MNDYAISNNRITNLLFYISYILFIIASFCTRVIPIIPVLKYIKVIAIMIALFNCVIQSKKYDIKTILGIILIIGICFLSYYFSKDETILMLFLIVFSSKKIKFNDFIKKDMKIKTCLVIIMIILYYLGLTNERVTYRDGVERVSFGFSHANIFGFVISMIVIDFLYLKRKNFKVAYSIIVIAAIVIILTFGDSRASLVLMICVLIMCVMYKLKLLTVIYKTGFKKIINNSFIVFTAITLILAFLYYKNNNLGIIIDNLFSKRLMHIVKYLERYPISLFGRELLFVSTEESKKLLISPWILDNSFVHIILRYGIVTYIVIAAFFKKSFECAYKNKDIILVFIMFFLVIYGLMETYIFKITYNPFLLYFGMVLYKSAIEGDVRNE